VGPAKDRLDVRTDSGPTAVPQSQPDPVANLSQCTSSPYTSNAVYDLANFGGTEDPC